MSKAKQSGTPVVPLPARGAPSSANSLGPRESAPRRHLDRFIRFALSANRRADHVAVAMALRRIIIARNMATAATNNTSTDSSPLIDTCTGGLPVFNKVLQ